MSLAERVKARFKLDGVTIASIIAVAGMVLTAIGFAIGSLFTGTGGTGGTPGKPDPSKPPDTQRRVKEGLKKFGEWLKELAKKSLAGLPAIIGSIVSFILKGAAGVVGFLAEHLIILAVIIVSAIIYGLIEGVGIVKNRNKNRGSENKVKSDK